MAVSLEFLFRECNMKKHVVMLNLKDPIMLDGKPTSDVCVFEVKSSPELLNHLETTFTKGINTNFGRVEVVGFDANNSPIDCPNHHHDITLNLENIDSFEMIDS